MKYQHYLLYLYPYNVLNNTDMEEEYVAIMDIETVNQDFDDIDLYGTKLVEDEEDDSGIEWE